MKKLLRFKPMNNPDLECVDEYRAYSYADLLCGIIELKEQDNWKSIFEVSMCKRFEEGKPDITHKYTVELNQRGNLSVMIQDSAEMYVYAIATVQIEIMTGLFLACSYLCPEDYDTAPEEYFQKELLDKYSMEDLDEENYIIIKE